MAEYGLKQALLLTVRKRHPRIWLLLSLIVAAGAVFGVLLPSDLCGPATVWLTARLDSYLAGGGTVSPHREFWTFLGWNGGALLFLLLSGLFDQGVVWLTLLLFLRGFSLAWVDCCLIRCRFPGSLLLSALLLPQLLVLLVSLRAGRTTFSCCRRRSKALPPGGAGLRELAGSGLLCLPVLLTAAFLQSRLTTLALRLASS
ncbi:MAG: hypothetical protein IK116_09425 [Firmicutes bacterium]|nr:hypothetical protein [Bacillota bacterium]